MKLDHNDNLEILINDTIVKPQLENYQPVTFVTNRGDIECCYYPVKDAKLGAIWIGGVGGGWDTPAQGLYPRICQQLQGQAVASLRIRYRYSTVLEEATLDALAGIEYLEAQGIRAIAITGHSFGGAVAIQAAAHSSISKTVVTLSSQTYGALVALQLAPRCSILLIHGINDRILAPICSETIYQIAQEPKRLILYPKAGHNLDEVAEEVYQTVYDWIPEQLNRPSMSNNMLPDG